MNEKHIFLLAIAIAAVVTAGILTLRRRKEGQTCGAFKGRCDKDLKCLNGVCHKQMPSALRSASPSSILGVWLPGEQSGKWKIRISEHSTLPKPFTLQYSLMRPGQEDVVLSLGQVVNGEVKFTTIDTGMQDTVAWDDANTWHFANDAGSPPQYFRRVSS